MREQVLQTTVEQGKLHLGLGCYMNSSSPEAEIRTIFNALTNSNKEFLVFQNCIYRAFV